MFVVLHTDELNFKIFLSQEELTALLTSGMALGRHFFTGSWGQRQGKVTLSTFTRGIFTGRYWLALAFLYKIKNKACVKIKCTYKTRTYNFTY